MTGSGRTGTKSEESVELNCLSHRIWNAVRAHNKRMAKHFFVSKKATRHFFTVYEEFEKIIQIVVAKGLKKRYNYNWIKFEFYINNNTESGGLQMSNSAKLSARERIESLVDANSFVEIGGMITKRNTDFNMRKKQCRQTV